MRISTYQNASWAKHKMMDLSVEQLHARNRVTTGKKYLKMSDNPLATSKSFAIQQSLENIGHMQKDIADSSNILKKTESTLQGIYKALSRARDLTVQAANGTTNDENMEAIKTEVNQLLEQAIYLGNTKEDGRYLFGGDSQQKPFTPDGDYQGSKNDVTWTLEGGFEVKVFRDGEELVGGVIDTLKEIQGALEKGDKAELSSLIDKSQEKMDGILNRTTEIGATMNTLSGFETILKEQTLTIQENRKELEDVDMAVAITELAYINATYEATLKAVSTMNKVSMLDYM
ncbi:flagellar hook-associated protein 3 [Bacillus manliponensis]|uniref:flagellar hook-associated protein 3 n=1 Tax=Bacillus manliponensis TaxID=574376 RepID=UPI0035117810